MKYIIGKTAVLPYMEKTECHMTGQYLYVEKTIMIISNIKACLSINHSQEK